MIRESLCPYAIRTLSVLKIDGSMRMHIESRAANKIVIKYRYPILRLENLLDDLHGVVIFSLIDLTRGYSQIRIYDGD